MHYIPDRNYVAAKFSGCRRSHYQTSNGQFPLFLVLGVLLGFKVSLHPLYFLTDRNPLSIKGSNIGDLKFSTAICTATILRLHSDVYLKFAERLNDAVSSNGAIPDDGGTVDTRPRPNMSAPIDLHTHPHIHSCTERHLQEMGKDLVKKADRQRVQ